MAVRLTDTQSCLTFFQRHVLVSLKFWHNQPAVQGLDIPTLEQEQEDILKTVSFGLDTREAWPLVRDLMLAFTHFMERRGYWQVWNDLLQRAISVAQRVGDVDGAITLSALLARLYGRQSRLKETIYHYRQVIRLARRAGNLYEEARACTNMGYHYIDGGRWWRAEVLCDHALAIFEQLDSPHGLAHTKNHLGVLYTRQKVWRLADQHLQQACAIWRSMGDQHGLSRGLINLGMLYSEMSRPVETLNYLHEALLQIEATGEEVEIGTVWMNLGIAHRQNGELETARHYLEQAQKVFHQYSNSLALAQVLDNLGVVYLRQGQWSAAKQVLDQALEKYQLLHNWDGEIRTLLNMVEYEFIQQDWMKASQRVVKLEFLVSHYSQGDQKIYLQERINEYRRSLTNLHPSATATSHAGN